METIKGPAAQGSDPEVVQALRAARARIEKGWRQGVLAEDAEGRSCHEEAAAAVAWCIYGATGFSKAGLRADRALRELLKKDPSEWNDKPGRTRAEVLALIDKAIALVAASEQPPAGPSAIASDSTSEGDDP